MSWFQITLTATRVQAPKIVEALEANGALSVSIEGAEDENVLQAAIESTPLWSANRVIGLFPESTPVSDLVARLRAALGDAGVAEHRVDLLPDTDWARAWMSRYRPLHVGQRLWICPSWCPPPDPAAVNVILDPGLAFGTGTHPTTALCLEWLAAHALADRTLIDYGCGSGILAIAALKLGARHAYAVDIDPLALVASRDNAARNDVAQRLTAVGPDALAPGLVADVVIANILARPLIDLAPRLTGLVRPRGRVLLTGVLAEQADEVQAHYGACVTFETRHRAEWILLAGVKH